MFKKIMKKKWLTGLGVAGVLGISYFVFGGSAALGNTYVLATVERGTVIASISGNGQVAVSDQVDIKPKASGDITYVGIKNGQYVKTGQVLAYIDATDAQRAMRDAQISLESAQISLQKMQRNQSANNQTTADDLDQSYGDAYNKVSNIFLDLPDLVDVARGILYDSTVESGGCGNICAYGNLVSEDFRHELTSMINRSESDYIAAKNSFDPNFQTYRGTRVDSSPEDVTSLLTTTQATVGRLVQAVKSEQNLIDVVVTNINAEAAKKTHKGNVPQQVLTYQNSIGTATGQLNTMVASLASVQRSIESSQRSLDDAQLSNPIDIATQENTVKQRQASLQDAQRSLANYSVRAPFAGTVTKVTIKKGDTVSGGTLVATLLTPKNIAIISLNEVDASKVKVGQKVTLTFDAVDGLTVTGAIAEVDSLGTVSQGVVNYGVTIGFDTQDNRVKPGMSVAAAIITDVKQNVLMVPSGAVKSQSGIVYVQVTDNAVPVGTAQLSAAVAILRDQMVEVGLSSDTMTEVISGLAEGDTIVARTVAPSTKTTTTSSGASGLRLPAGGGTFRGGR